MAKVTYIAPVETVSGKLSKSHAVCFMHRKADTTNAQRNYTSMSTYRRTSFNPTEVLRQQRFGAISAAAIARRYDPSKMDADQEAFRAQSTYKTLYQYIWHKEAEKYDDEH